jgi:hypothetical protein
VKSEAIGNGIGEQPAALLRPFQLVDERKDRGRDHRIPTGEADSQPFERTC